MANFVAAFASREQIGSLSSAQILLDVQRGNEIAQLLAGCLQPEEIARRVTAGIVEKFDCVFARIWLLEPEQASLRLVASSGMYTNLHGRFARVPLGAYKVGKIAQNRAAFLSNNLSHESWVGDREWAIANQIRGFAGYPLIARDRVVGVLATFSQQVMAPEFLEVLQMLCTISAIALDTALHYQQEQQIHPAIAPLTFNAAPLSDQLVSLLPSTRFMLLGTEQPLPPSVVFMFLQMAEVLQQLNCSYCRLIYTPAQVRLEAIAAIAPDSPPAPFAAMDELNAIAAGCGGKLEIQTQDSRGALQIRLDVPHLPSDSARLAVRVRCSTPILQMAFTQLARMAGLTLASEPNDTVPVLTNDVTQLKLANKIVWIQSSTQPPPAGVQISINLSTTPDQLQQAIIAACQGAVWGPLPIAQPLSERELEILRLLTQGHRDRDIADHLVISESTVKFHINNVLTKFKARTRYQAIHQAVVHGWL
jgi:DNA-binding CsgD family transcriptional regulator